MVSKNALHCILLMTLHLAAASSATQGIEQRQPQSLPKDDRHKEIMTKSLTSSNIYDGQIRHLLIVPNSDGRRDKIKEMNKEEESFPVKKCTADLLPMNTFIKQRNNFPDNDDFNRPAIDGKHFIDGAILALAKNCTMSKFFKEITDQTRTVKNEYKVNRWTDINKNQFLGYKHAMFLTQKNVDSNTVAAGKMLTRPRRDAATTVSMNHVPRNPLHSHILVQGQENDSYQAKSQQILNALYSYLNTILDSNSLIRYDQAISLDNDNSNMYASHRNMDTLVHSNTSQSHFPRTTIYLLPSYDSHNGEVLQPIHNMLNTPKSISTDKISWRNIFNYLASPTISDSFTNDNMFNNLVQLFPAMPSIPTRKDAILRLNSARSIREENQHMKNKNITTKVTTHTMIPSIFASILKNAVLIATSDMNSVKNLNDTKLLKLQNTSYQVTSPVKSINNPGTILDSFLTPPSQDDLNSSALSSRTQPTTFTGSREKTPSNQTLGNKLPYVFMTPSIAFMHKPQKKSYNLPTSEGQNSTLQTDQSKSSLDIQRLFTLISNPSLPYMTSRNDAFLTLSETIAKEKSVRNSAKVPEVLGVMQQTKNTVINNNSQPSKNIQFRNVTSISNSTVATNFSHMSPLIQNMSKNLLNLFTSPAVLVRSLSNIEVPKDVTSVRLQAEFPMLISRQGLQLPLLFPIYNNGLASSQSLPFIEQRGQSPLFLPTYEERLKSVLFLRNAELENTSRQSKDEKKTLLYNRIDKKISNEVGHLSQISVHITSEERLNISSSDIQPKSYILNQVLLSSEKIRTPHSQLNHVEAATNANTSRIVLQGQGESNVNFIQIPSNDDQMEESTAHSRAIEKHGKNSSVKNHNYFNSDPSVSSSLNVGNANIDAKQSSTSTVADIFSHVSKSAIDRMKAAAEASLRTTTN